MSIIRNGPPKHPSSEKWYYLQWNATELQGAVISTITWTVPSGITKLSESINGMFVGIKLSGGTLGQEYACALEINTNLPEILHATLVVKIDSKGH